MVNSAYEIARKEAFVKLDARQSTKPQQCTPGKSIPCKNRCIPANYKCRDDVQLSVREKAQIAEVINRAEDKYAGRSIRDLQQEARERGVYRANHQNKSTLIKTLKLLDQNPQAQENLRKTLEKRRKTRQTVLKASPELAKTWKSIQTVSKAYKQNPDQAGLIIAAGLMGISTALASKVRDRHKDGLKESASLAFNRAKNLPIDRTSKNDLVFTVGGFGSIGSRGEKMRDLLITPLDNSPSEKWLKGNNHYIPFNHNDFDINTPNVSKRDVSGKYNPLYLGYIARQGFGRFLTNQRRGRNDAAVELAAQLYAYGNRYDKKRLNVLAHGVGGNVVDEATEILARMPRLKRNGPTGEQLSSRLNIVRMGSPSFGMSNDARWRRKINHRTITSKQDPFSILPKRAAQWIDSVKGGEIEDYLKNTEVRERIKESFGYYSSSLSGSTVAAARKKERRKAIGEAISAVNPGAGVLWNQIGKIQDKARDNPAAAAALSFAVVTTTTVAAHNRAKRRYQQGLANAANQAIAEVPNTRINNPRNRNNITIAVGGTGQPSAEIVDNLPESIKGKNGVGGKTMVINAEDYGVSSANVPAYIKPDSRAYYAYLAANGFGGELKKGLVGPPVDPEAIKLAALLYGHGDRNFKKNKKNYNLNMIAAGDGAIKARAAMEILNRMGPKGRQIAKQVKLASLGSPGFGLNNEDAGTLTNQKYVAPEFSYMGDKDFFNLFPGRNSATTIRPKQVGHSVKDYLASEEVQRSLLENFY